MKRLPIISVFLALSLLAHSQEKSITPGGFVRTGAYLSTDDYRHKINAAFADAAFKLTATDNLSFRGFADVRFRSGIQFGEVQSDVWLKEAWGMYYNDIFSISGGNKVIRWGRTDIFTPLSKLNPTDYLLRSPDKEDADMGNLLAELVITPAPFLKLSFVAVPLWNPSLLMTAPLELPDYVTINLPHGLNAGNKGFSAGIRSDITVRRTDIGIQWFHGPDPMPGLELTSAALSNPDSINLTMTGVPYMINSAGIDFETALASVVIRGSLSWSVPVKEITGNEEVPFPQAEWVGGFDWAPGSFRLTAEYYGKKVLDFHEPVVESLAGQDIDLSGLMALLMMSGLTPGEFARLQTESFNRMFNYQNRQYYHSAGIRAGYEALYGKLLPSFTVVYNFTTEDILVMPEIEYKPADAITVTAGMEYYSGPDRSLYDLVEEFMSAAFVSLRIDF